MAHSRAKEKTDEVKARVTPEMREQVAAIADERGESESLIVREAIAEYLERHSVSAWKKVAGKKPGRLHGLIHRVRGIKATAGLVAAGVITWVLELPVTHHLALAMTTALVLDATDGKMVLLGGLQLW